jgi:hypothetical protein
MLHIHMKATRTLHSDFLKSHLFAPYLFQPFAFTANPHCHPTTIANMRSSSFFWTILAASAPSQAIDASWGNIGVGSSPGPWPLEEGYKKGEEAGRHPNATRAVTFDRQYENSQETWGWRINITELDIPNNPNQFGNASANSSENHRVTNTQWQLTWPGNENNFNEFLKKRNVRASFAGYIGNKPSNVTNGFNASSTNGDCTALLGAECVAGLKRGAVGTTLKITGNQGCDDTLDLRDADGASFYNSAIGWSKSPQRDTTPQISSGLTN